MKSERGNMNQTTQNRGSWYTVQPQYYDFPGTASKRRMTGVSHYREQVNAGLVDSLTRQVSYELI